MRPRTAGLALLLFAALACLNALRGLNEPDEARYAVIALRMAQDASASWWIPEMSGFVHVDKPPLVYWLTALAARAFGVQEWALRLPSLLGAALALLGLWWLACARAGPEAARWSVVTCAGALQFWAMSSVLSPDMLLTGFTTLAAGAWARGVGAAPRAAHSWWAVSCVAWIGAWWTKATPALLVLLVIALALVILRDRDGLRRLRPGVTTVLVLLAGAPWYLDLIARFPELLEFFLGRELVGRVAGHPDGREGPIYYYLVIAVAAWLPWWLLAAPRAGWIRGVAALETTVVGLGVLALSLISSKLPSYLLPMLPWGALLIGRLLAASPSGGQGAGPRVAAIGIAASALLAIAVLVTLREAGPSLGSQSSMRTIAAQLRAAGARTVLSDHYRPGLEIYFGPRVFYLEDRPRAEIDGDPGIVPALGRPRFVSSAEILNGAWPGRTPGLWILRRADRDAPAVAELLRSRGGGREIRAGDFLISELR